eukprot:2138244-Amphidinium_carterae.1
MPTRVRHESGALMQGQVDKTEWSVACGPCGGDMGAGHSDKRYVLVMAATMMIDCKQVVMLFNNPIKSKHSSTIANVITEVVLCLRNSTHTGHLDIQPTTPASIQWVGRTDGGIEEDHSKETDPERQHVN